MQCQLKGIRTYHVQHYGIAAPALPDNADALPLHEPPPLHEDPGSPPQDEDSGGDSDAGNMDHAVMLENLSRDILSVPSETNASEQTIVRMCEIFQYRLQHILAPHNISLPESMYMLRKTAGEEARPNRNPKSELWPICSCLGHIFDPTLALVCPKCALPMPSVTDPDVAKVSIFDVVGRLQALMAVRPFAQCFHYAANRDQNLNDGDVWGADILRDSSREYRFTTFVLRVSADATVSQSFMNKSTIPFVALVLNYHPRLRKALGALLPFFAMPKTKELNKVFSIVTTAVLTRFSSCFRSFRGVPGAGFTVFDAYTQTTRVMFLDFSFIVEDIRGIPGQLNSSQAPSIDGSCQRCKVKGISIAKASSVYFAAITYRPRNDPRREVYRRYFADLQHDNSPLASRIVTQLTQLAAKGPAQKVTTEWSKSPAARTPSLPGRKPCFKGDSLYEVCFPGMDILARCAVDPAHEWGNLWIRLASLIANKGQNSMTMVRWKKESTKLGRFSEYEYGNTIKAYISTICLCICTICTIH